MVVRSLPGSLLVVCVMLGSFSGCLSEPTESTLAGYLDTTETFLGADPGDAELELVCVTPHEVLVTPLTAEHGYGSAFPLFELEYPVGDPTYCYFVQRAQPMDHFLGFLGLEAGNQEGETGWDRLWTNNDGRNLFAGEAHAGALRAWPDEDLTRPEPSREVEMDPCSYCGLVVLEATTDPVYDTDVQSYLYACVGFGTYEGSQVLVATLSYIDDSNYPILVVVPITDTPIPVLGKVERIPGGLGFSSNKTYFEEEEELLVEAMFHTEEDAAGQITSLSGRIAFLSYIPGYEWGYVVNTIDPLSLFNCEPPPGD
jgi:hypothetical protein